MTVSYIVGDLFDAAFGTEPGSVALGHGVNCQANMGGGVAAIFARKFPRMLTRYNEVCRAQRLKPGRVFIWFQDGNYVMNLASQDLPGANADYGMLAQALDNAIIQCKNLGVKALALPQIGCGIGGLEWELVSGIITECSQYHDFDIDVYALNEKDFKSAD